MLSFGEFIVLCGKNAGYRKNDVLSLSHITNVKLRDPGKLSLDDIRRLRDALNIPEHSVERYVLEILRK